MPFAVIGSTTEVTVGEGRRVLGRQYAWGVAEVENEEYSDFKKLRSLLIRTHLYDLISTTNEIHYESYRLSRIENRGQFIDRGSEAKARAAFEAQLKEEEQRFRARLADKVHVEESRFQQWEQRLVQERARLTKNLETEHLQLKQLIAEVESLEVAAGKKK
jgi:cell division control protein 12